MINYLLWGSSPINPEALMCLKPTVLFGITLLTVWPVKWTTTSIINEVAVIFYSPSNKPLNEFGFISGCLFMAFPQESNLAQDESKAIRGLGGLGSGAPFRPGRGVLWRAGDGGKRDRKKKGEKSPRGNLPHCGKKPHNTTPLLNPSGN